VRIPRVLAVGCVLSALLSLGALSSAAQASAAGSVEFDAYVKPSDGQLEPVRGMAFYLLSRSLSDMRKEIESTDELPDLDHFIAQLSLSTELKEWMKKHSRIDLAGNGFIKDLTADDVIDIPEFLAAYKSQNGSALHTILPEPKYKSGDEQKNPEKYKLQREQYHEALVHYVQANMDSLQGLDAALRDFNPNPRWIHLQSEHRRLIERRAMQLAQTRYLVATAVTDLSGRAAFEGLTPGQYWISNLDIPALAGDVRLHWDLGITVAPAKTARLQLSNVNSLEASE
jgi:hypothetical protein